MEVILQDGISPCTVTVVLQVETLLLLSVTVSTTVFVPIFAQVKLVFDAWSDLMPDASLLPLSISAAVMVAIPLTSVIVAGLQTAFGAMLSTTVTVAWQVEVLPLTS